MLRHEDNEDVTMDNGGNIEGTPCKIAKVSVEEWSENSKDKEGRLTKTKQ